MGPALQNSVAITKSTDQPPAIEPAFPVWSSTTKSFHVPLGFVPANAWSLPAPLGTGAGAGNASDAPMLTGRYVPDVIGVKGSRSSAASSSKVRVTFAAPAPEPTSDIRTRL